MSTNYAGVSIHSNTNEEDAQLTIMSRVDQQFVQLSQVAATKSIIITHQNPERIRRRCKTQRRRERRAKLEPHIEQLQPTLFNKDNKARTRQTSLPWRLPPATRM